MSRLPPPPPQQCVWTSVTLVKWEPAHLQLHWYLAVHPFILSQQDLSWMHGQDGGWVGGVVECHGSLFRPEELHPWREMAPKPPWKQIDWPLTQASMACLVQIWTNRYECSSAVHSIESLSSSFFVVFLRIRITPNPLDSKSQWRYYIVKNLFSMYPQFISEPFRKASWHFHVCPTRSTVNQKENALFVNGQWICTQVSCYTPRQMLAPPWFLSPFKHVDDQLSQSQTTHQL